MIPNPVYDARMTRLWVDSTLLMADAATVLMLRTLTMMGGGRSAIREGERMLAEKVEAGFELAGAVASGRVKSPQGAARKAVSVYGKRVRANRKRLG
jgi:TRAP-type mannitol/chloroaromatic compound transport system substrate-binding protein